MEGKSLDDGSAMEFLTLGLNMAGMAMSGKGMVESGNKICKSIKESGVTNKIAGKVKAGAKSAWNNNSGKVDLDAPIGGSGRKISFVEGELFESHIEKEGVRIDALAEVEINDKKLILKDIAIYANKGDIPNEVGVSEIKAWLNAVKKKAGMQGFEELQILAQRVQNSSSANTGSIINHTLNLKGGN